MRPTDLRRAVAPAPGAGGAVGLNPAPIEGKLFPMNQHVVPPHTAPGFLERFVPGARR